MDLFQNRNYEGTEKRVTEINHNFRYSINIKFPTNRQIKIDYKYLSLIRLVEPIGRVNINITAKPWLCQKR